MANERIVIATKTTSGAPSLASLVDGEQCWVVPDAQMYIRIGANVQAQGLTLAQVNALILSGGGTSPTHQQDTFWAEENGGISANQDEYSWGNGATGNIGVPMPYDGFEATSMFISAEVAPAIGTAVIMLLVNGATTTHTVTFTSKDQIVNFVTPIAISKGLRIGFRTVSTSGGTWSDVRVGVTGRFPLLTIV